MESLTTFPMTQNISIFKSFSKKKKKKNEIKKVKPRTVETKKRKPIMNDEAPKLFYEQMGLINAMNYLMQKKK